MKKLFCLLTSVLIFFSSKAQEKLPYAEIPEYPETFTAETVAARMVDGVGFRYYWATEGLRPQDLAFRPNDEARTSRETLEHIYGLTVVIVNSTRQVANQRIDVAEWSFEELRAKTLANLEEASNTLKSKEAALEEFEIIYGTGDDAVKFPFWNQVNGPIADALWHIGQVVSFRRSSGNPFNSNVSVLMGKLRDK